MAGAARFTWDELSDDTLRLPESVAAGTTAEFYIEHTTRYAPMGPLDKSGATLDLPPVRHVLEVRITRAHLEEFAPRRTPSRRWTRLAAIPGVDLVKVDEAYQAPAMTVARLTVGEYPDRFRCGHDDTPAVSWFEWLDGDGTELGAIADATERSPQYEFAPGGGSLFWFTLLSVHPAFRGQHLGARLLGHALWVLPRRPDDLALMEAMPTDCPFGGPAPVRTRASILRLSRYYQRLGLERWTKRRPARAFPPGMSSDDGGAEIPAPVLYHLGSSRLPFDRRSNASVEVPAGSA